MLLRRSSSNASPARSLKAANRPLSKNRPKKNVKKARKGLIYLKLNLKDSVASGLINPINKVQLSILNTGIIKINDEVSKASGIIPKKPFDLNKNKFDKHLELFNQYKVLLDIEYHVSISSDAADIELLQVCYSNTLFPSSYATKTDGFQK